MSLSSSSPQSSLSPSLSLSSSPSSSSAKGEQSNDKQQTSPANSSEDLIDTDPGDLIIQRKIQNKNLRNSMNQAKMAPQEQNGPYKCAFCKETCRTKTKSIEHLRSAHPERLPYYCKVKACSYVSKDALSVRMHMERKHEIGYHESRDYVGNRFGPLIWPKCDQCGRILNGPEELATHIISHTKTGYRCKWEGCGEFYGCPTQGIKHVKEVHFMNNAQFENCKEMDFLDVIGTKGTSFKKRGKSKSKRWKRIPRRSKLTSANGKPVKTESIHQKAINPAPESKIKSPKHRKAKTKSWSSLSSGAKQSNGQQESTAEDWIEINDSNSDDLITENNQNQDLNNSTTEPIKAKMPRQTDFHGRFKCCFCAATFDKSNKSAVHMRSEHPELMPYYCKMANCEYMGVLQKALRWHVERKHNIKRNEAANYFGIHTQRVTRASPCPQCNRKIAGVEWLVAHLAAHNNDGYRCTFNECGYFFASLKLAEKHIEKDHFKNDPKFARCNAKDYLENVKPDTSHNPEPNKSSKTVKTNHASLVSNGRKPKSDKPKSGKPKPNNRKPVDKVPPPKNKEPQLSFLEKGAPMSLTTLHLFFNKTKLKSYRTVPVAGIRDCAPFEESADAFIAFENHRKLLDPDYEQQPLPTPSAASSVAALSDDDDANDPTFKGRPARNKTKRHMRDYSLTSPKKRKQSKLAETEPTDAQVNRSEQGDDDEVDELMAVDDDDELSDTQIALIRPAKYQCCICINTTFDHAQYLNAHYRADHHQLLPFYCTQSNCTYASFQAYKCRMHAKIVHFIKDWDETANFLGIRETANCACKHCGRTLDSIRELKEHIESHFTCSGYRCLWKNECGFFYRFCADARTHVREDHFKDDPTFAKRNPMDFLKAIKRGTYWGTVHYYDASGNEIPSDLASNAAKYILSKLDMKQNPTTDLISSIDMIEEAKKINNDDIAQQMNSTNEPLNYLSQTCYLCGHEYDNSRFLQEHYRFAHHGVFYCMWPLCPFASFQSNLARDHVQSEHLSAFSAPLKAENYVADSSVEDWFYFNSENSSTSSSTVSSYSEEYLAESETSNPQTSTTTHESADISQAMEPNPVIHECTICAEEFPSAQAKNDHDLIMHPETLPFYCKWTSENTPCLFVSFIPQTIKDHIQKDHSVEHNAAAAVYVGSRLTVSRSGPQLAQSTPEKSTAATSTFTAASISTATSIFTSASTSAFSSYAVEYPTESSQIQLNPQPNIITTVPTNPTSDASADIYQVIDSAPNKTIHKCDICNEEFLNSRALFEHNCSMHPEALHPEALHPEAQPYYCRCRYCPFEASEPHMIKEHIQREHSAEHDATANYVSNQQENVCQECGRTLGNLSSLQRHLDSHSQQGYRCTWDGCGFFFSSTNEHAMEHVLNDHMHLVVDLLQRALFDPLDWLEIVNPEILSPTSTVTATAASTATSSSPVELTNPKDSPTIATTSSPAESAQNLSPQTKDIIKTTTTSTNIPKSISRAYIYDPNRAIYKCLLCVHECKTLQVMCHHERKCHPETRSFYCKFEKCGYVTFNSGKLTDHIKRVHEHDYQYSNYFGTRFVAGRSCPECRRTFDNTSDLRLHLQYHKKIGYSCTFCGFFFSEISKISINHVEEEHLKRLYDPVNRNPKDFLELKFPNTAASAQVSTAISASTQVPFTVPTSTATLSATATAIRVPEQTNSHSVKQLQSNGTSSTVTQRILPPSSNRVDTETPKQTSLRAIHVSSFKKINNNQLKLQQQILITTIPRITKPTVFYITVGTSKIAVMVKPTSSIPNNTAQPIVNNSVHNDSNSSVPSVTTAPATISSAQSTFEPDMGMLDNHGEIVEATEQPEVSMELFNRPQSQPENPINEDHLSDNNNNDDLNQSTSNDVQMSGFDNVMDYEDGKVSVSCQASGEVEDVEMEEQNEELVGVVEVNEGAEMKKLEEEINEESQSSTTDQNDQQTESVHENMDYEDDEVIEEELEKDDAEKEGNANLDEVNEPEEEGKIDEVEEMENVQTSSTSTVPSAQQSATPVQQHDPFCFECHKKANPLQAIQHCSLCPLTYHLECIESGNLFRKQQLAIERYEALEQKPQDDDSGDINKLLTLPGVCDECVLKIVGKHYNRSKDGFSVESGVLKKDVVTTYHNIASLLINKADKYKFRGWKKLFKSSEASKTIIQAMDLETIASKEDKYASLDELLFDVKLIVHNRTISNHHCPYTVDCLAQLMGYAKTESEHIRLCDSCNRLYYKEAPENLPKKIYQGDTPYGEVFQMGCQNPHTVVWVRIDGEWWPAKVFRKYTECSWETSLDWVQVMTFGPQKFHTVEPSKLYNYSRKVPENGQLETQDQHDAVEEANYYYKTLDNKFLDCKKPERPRPYETGNLYINTKQDASQLPIADPYDATGKSIPWKCQSCGKRLTDHRLDLCTVSFCSTKCKKVFLGRSRK